MPKGYRNLTLASRKRWAESWWVYWYKVSEGLIVREGRGLYRIAPQAGKPEAAS